MIFVYSSILMRKRLSTISGSTRLPSDCFCGKLNSSRQILEQSRFIPLNAIIYILCGIEHFDHLCLSQFREWLSSVQLEEYIGIFERNGIMTFGSLYHHAHDAADLIPIIGERNKADAALLWNSTPKHIRKQKRMQ